jgi:hybrid cluster-associated redox disulfide protein
MNGLTSVRSQGLANQSGPDETKEIAVEYIGMPVYLTPDITVKELLDRYPRLLQTFMGLGMMCVGCPTEAFHTVADVAKEYGYDLNKLIEYFQGIIDASEVPKH